jgi:hypothetical protein
VTLYSITETVPRPLNIRLLEIDLAHPGVSFRISPRDAGLPDGDETITQTTRQYVNEESAQVGVNTSFFRLEHSGEARPTNNNGLTASGGDVYSPWDANGQVGFNLSRTNAASIISAASNRPTGTETNPPGVELYNAGAGSGRLLQDGDNVAPADNATGSLGDLHPRTALGVAPGNKLLLATVDGRQPGFSEGMYLRELAELLRGYGATDAINLDGGGSTTMAIDHYGDGATRAQLVNRPVGRGLPNTERFNGASLGVFAARNPAYVPPTGLVHVPSQVGSVRILDDFEDGNGRFVTDPDYSGSNRGLRRAGSDGPSTARRDANAYFHGFAAHRVSTVSQDDPTWDGFRLRHLSGTGNPANNPQLGTAGFVGYWLKTTTPGLTASIGLDENLTAVIESGVPRDVIADGEWHLYEWDLADAAQWDSFANGDGALDGPVATVDSVLISSRTDQDAQVWIDTLAYNPAGSLTSLVPEPSAVTLLGFTALLVTRRRRQ